MRAGADVEDEDDEPDVEDIGVAASLPLMKDESSPVMVGESLDESCEESESRDQTYINSGERKIQDKQHLRLSEEEKVKLVN